MTSEESVPGVHGVTAPGLEAMSSRTFRRFVSITALLAGSFHCLHSLALPPDFIDVPDIVGWDEAVGLTFDGNGRMYVWERGGRVWIVENGTVSEPALIDISDEVGGWRDYGLLGFALDPNFLENGQIFLLYVVDHHHLVHAGTPSYNPGTNEYFRATIGRVTRYTANAADNFNSVDPSSRTILIGETISTGFPIVHQSHGIGSLVFGTDGTLLVSCGDAASYETIDTSGSDGGSYAPQALAENILQPKEDVGAYRSQLVDSFNGKIVRIDPVSGDGVSSNPFYDGNAPRAPRSRVWSLGLRNPFRCALRPGTGSHDPTDGDPGALYIGDVGWNLWEDLHVATGPGQNFGWPAFEGLTLHPGYWSENVQNLDAPIPPFGGCERQYFYFRELIIQDTLDPAPSFPNPCNGSEQVPNSIPTFLHTRPEIEWHHGSGPSRVPIFNGDNAAERQVGAPGSPVPGPQFGGNSSTGGTWYSGTAFPAPYRNSYFHGDFGAGWIRSFSFDGNNRLTAVREFSTNAGGVVFVAEHDGDLYYIRWGNQIRRISYTPSGNQPPTAVASADVSFGSTPLSVQFQGNGSSDPEEQPLDYDWDFDDTSSSTLANPSHVFTVTPGTPTQFTVTLTVTDAQDLSSMVSLIVSVENTPPSVTITRPLDGQKYPLGVGDLTSPLEATVTDLEHGPEQLTCAWRTLLHHNDHSHPEPYDNGCESSTVITPLGCGSEDYHYQVTLTVTDDAGLSTTDSVFLYPDCDAAAFVRSDGNGDGDTDLSDAVFTLDYLFQNGTASSCADTQDSNDDGAIDISDPIYTLNYLFSTGAGPPAPFPGCGFDVTLDELECFGYAGCP